MDTNRLIELLAKLKNGQMSVEAAADRLKDLPFENMGFACIDHHRSLRKGCPEVIFGENKLTKDIISIAQQILEQEGRVLITRVSSEKAKAILESFPEGIYYERSRMLTLVRRQATHSGRGIIAVISAGTSDIPVAEEAAVTAEFMGNHVDTIYDIGVSGIHRLLAHRERLMKASVLIVVAGMEGALPSVVGGLVDKPVIAVPTSIGYGASFGGIAALLGMLNSCAAGVTVVNIDNGFGAGYAAAVINRIE